MADGEGFARRVTSGTLEAFRRFLATGRQRPAAGSGSSGGGADGAAEPGDPFEGTSIGVTPPAGGSIRTGRATREVDPGGPVAPQAAVRGRLVWEKELSATDAQRQAGNPTGDLRLTQAGFRVDGERVDHATYFREDVFGALDWTPSIGSHAYAREEAVGRFRVNVGGRDRGVIELELTHRPRGDSGQRNYKTSLHWGEDLGELLRTYDVTGQTLRLYETDIPGYWEIVIA